MKGKKRQFKPNVFQLVASFKGKVDFRIEKHVQTWVISEGAAVSVWGWRGAVSINKALWLLANEQ